LDGRRLGELIMSYNNHRTAYLNVLRKAQAKKVATGTTSDKGGLLRRSMKPEETDSTKEPSEMVVEYVREINMARKALADG